MAVVHAVNFNSTYYSVTSSNASVGLNENTTTVPTTTPTNGAVNGNGLFYGAVLSWVPLGCTATQLNVYSQQTSTITVTLRTGAPGAMAASTLVCSVSQNSSCTATGSVMVAAGQFIDYQISGASGTAAPVWTALQCQ
jgi:hypothetical protein